MDYKWQRSGYDPWRAYLREEDDERLGEILQGFYIYLDSEHTHYNRKVITFWYVLNDVGGLSGTMQIMAGLAFLIFAKPT